MMTAKDNIAAVSAQIKTLDGESAAISADQARLRENIKALKDTADTRQQLARYIAKAGEQESRLEQINDEKRAALAEQRRLQDGLNALIRSLIFTKKV